MNPQRVPACQSLPHAIQPTMYEGGTAVVVETVGSVGNPHSGLSTLSTVFSTFYFPWPIS